MTGGKSGASRRKWTLRILLGSFVAFELSAMILEIQRKVRPGVIVRVLPWAALFGLAAGLVYFLIDKRINP